MRLQQLLLIHCPLGRLSAVITNRSPSSNQHLVASKTFRASIKSLMIVSDEWHSIHFTRRQRAMSRRLF
jgi:hypothetical protein